MYHVTRQEQNKIEIALTDDLTLNEFKQVIHQLESLCTSHPSINVLFNATELNSYSFRIFLEEYDFYKKYKSHLKNLFLVSDRKLEKFILDQFNKFTETTFKTFDSSQIEDVRKLIFPSRLP